jgi:hypothetical protein
MERPSTGKIYKTINKIYCMKKCIQYIILIFFSQNCFAQNVGIGTLTPLQKLHVEGAAFLNGNVGIGSNSPTRPLCFPAILGKKISLYPGALGDAGFGVFGNELRLHSDNSGADITLGYDDYTSGFTERIRNKGTGNVGIGTTNPMQKLEVSGNIKAADFLYSTPKTLHYILSGIDFVAVKSSDTTITGVGSAEITLLTSVVSKNIMAPVHLPDGVTMVNMKVYVNDFSVPDNLQVVFYRKTITSNFFPDNLGSVNSSGSTGLVLSQTSLFTNVVDNSLYTYYISVGPESPSNSFPGNTYLRAVIIEYTSTGTQ